MVRFRRAGLLVVAAISLGGGFHPPLAVEAHFPPALNLECNDGTDGAGRAIPHDFGMVNGGSMMTGFTGEFGVGFAQVYDGSLKPCGTHDFCPDGEDLTPPIDPSNDDLPDGTDPSGDDIYVHCANVIIGGTQVPIGDGEYEFGIGGAFLPDSHHDPLTNGYHVQPFATDGGFFFGSDEDNDGDVEEGTECFESHASGGNYATACAAGADGGWWFFTKCNATTLADWTLTTNGALLRLDLGDDDEDGTPNSLEDDDFDGVPNGAEDGDGDGVPDYVNGNWDPTITPGSISPDLRVACLAQGHITDGGCPTPDCLVLPECFDGKDNDGDSTIDWPRDTECDGPGDISEKPECSDGLDNDGDSDADWPEDEDCEDAADDSESPSSSAHDMSASARLRRVLSGDVKLVRVAPDPTTYVDPGSFVLP